MNRNRCIRDRKSKKEAAKRRQIETFDECCLQNKRGVWYAVMPVPRDAQEALAGKAARKLRFTASLETEDADVAVARMPAQISKWRLQIAMARRKSAKTVRAGHWPSSGESRADGWNMPSD